MNASFEESYYTLSEGGENNKEIIVTYPPNTEPIKLNITQGKHFALALQLTQPC